MTHVEKIIRGIEVCMDYEKGYYVGPRPDDAEGMSARNLRRQLCSLGPVKCGACGLCAYGQEWVRREEGR